MYGCSQRFAKSAFFHRKIRGEPEELIGTGYDVACEAAVDSMAHASPLRTEHEFPSAAINARPTRNSGGAEDTDTVSLTPSGYVLAFGNYVSRDFVPENHGRKIAKRVVQHMQICTANATPGDFEGDLIRSHHRFTHIADLNVPRAFGELYQCIHAECSRALTM